MDGRQKGEGKKPCFSESEKLFRAFSRIIFQPRPVARLGKGEETLPSLFFSLFSRLLIRSYIYKIPITNIISSQLTFNRSCAKKIQIRGLLVPSHALYGVHNTKNTVHRASKDSAMPVNMHTGSTILRTRFTVQAKTRQWL